MKSPPNQLLVRATALLARLGGHRDGISLRALAAETAIPPSTCVRLLRDLVALGWADQDGPRGTYRLGPRAATLEHGQPYREVLVAAARPVVAAVARRLPAQVLVAVLRGDRRLIVLRAEARPGGDPLCLAEERELFASASGRVLVAHLAWRERRRLVDAVGMPGHRRWPGVVTWDDLNRACAAIRAAGLEVNRPAEGGMNAVAVAIPDGAGGTAALAVGMPKAGWNEARAVRAAHDAARRVRAALARAG